MKKRVMALVVALMVIFAAAALGAELEDFQGEWKIDVVYVSLLPVDATYTDANGIKIKIDGLSTWTKIPGNQSILRETEMRNGYLYYELQEADGYMKITYSEDEDILHMKIKADDDVFEGDFRRVKRRDWSDHKKPISKYTKLKVGDSGDEVKDIQERLCELGWLERLDIDGEFGEKTESAVKGFQKASNMKDTGVADGKTQRALYSDGAVENMKTPEKVDTDATVELQLTVDGDEEG